MELKTGGNRMKEKHGHYEKRARAYRMIDEMIKQGASDVKIIYEVQTLFGFSENMIGKRIFLLERLKKENKGEG